VYQLTGFRPRPKAGGRLFVDISDALAATASRQNMLEVLGQADPLIRDALVNLLERGDFIKSISSNGPDQSHIKSNRGMSAADILAPVANDPEIVSGLIERSQAVLAALQQNIMATSGAALFDLIREDLRGLGKWLADPRNLAAIMAGINASAWINDRMCEWL